MYREKDREIAHLKRMLGELEPYVYRKIHYQTDWIYEKRTIHPPFKWSGNFAVFETEIDLYDKNTYLFAWFGGESLVVVDGKSYGQINPLQKELWLGRLSRGEHNVKVQVVPRGLFGNRENAVFEYSYLVEIDEEIRSVIDFTQAVIDLASRVEDESLALALIEATESFLAGVYIPRRTEEYKEASGYNSTIRNELKSVWDFAGFPLVHGFEYPEKEKLLKNFEDYKKEVFKLKKIWPKEGKLFLVGHSHIDYAWLWPVSETKRKLRRTFSNVLNLMEKYGITFAQSSAQMYEDVKNNDPELFERIKEAVEKGVWEPIGGMWVEPDTTVPSVESLIRQFLYGQRFFQENFGRRSKVCWLPDVFGFPHTLPQILKEAGMELFVTTKLYWNEATQFPYDLCIWKGLDGSEILYYSFNNPEEGYNGKINANALLSTWKNHRQKHIAPFALLSFGYGDGGGGPSDEMCRKIYSFKDLPKVPELKISTVEGFAKELKKAVSEKELPVWDGELYLELHRGTYTSQSRIKALHRQAEIALRNLELVSTLLGQDIQDEIDEKWKAVLRNEFHDILPGTSIRKVVEDTERELESVIRWAKEKMEEVAKKSAEKAEGFITVFNPYNIPMNLRFFLDRPFLLRYGEKKLRPKYGVEGYLYKIPKKIGPFESVAIPVEGIMDIQPPLGQTDIMGPVVLENKHLRVTVYRNGSFEVFSKKYGRNLFKKPPRLWIYKNIPYYWDNWDIDINTEKEGFPLEGYLHTVEYKPSRQFATVSYRYERSEIHECIILEGDSDILEIAYEVKWNTRRVILKKVFDIDVLTRKALFDVDGGYVERPTTRNTKYEMARFEVPMHMWVSLSENGFGVAILNDSKYGCSVNASKVGISLIKAGIFPDFYADEGMHFFKLGIFPHGGNVEDVIKASIRFSGGLLVLEGKLNIPKLELLGGLFKILALKRSKEGMVLRFVEVAGRSGRAKVKLWRRFEIHRSNILEDNLGKITTSDELELDYRPFKIYTLLLKPV